MVDLPEGHSVILGELNRYETMKAAAGGKGINVTKQLNKHGWDSNIFLALPKISRGVQSYFDMEDYGACVYEVPGELRINLKVHTRKEDGQVRMTEFNGSGDIIDHDTSNNLCYMLENAVLSSNVTVLSGSLLPGIPMDIYERLARGINKSNGISVLDASGEALRLAVKGGVDICKPNRDELRELTKLPCQSIEEVKHSIEQYCRKSACQLILCSLGYDGAVLTNGYDTFHARIPNPEERIISLTGAGDAMTASLAAFAATTPLTMGFGDYVKLENMDHLLKVAMATAQATVRLQSSETPSEKEVESWISKIKTTKLV